MSAAFLCYGLALVLLRRTSLRLHWVWIVGIAIVMHLAPWRGQPMWDHDAYRYHWDGLLLAKGVNPFRYAPGDHELWQYRDQYWEPMDYKWIKTIYPPITQYLLAWTYHLDPTPRRVFVLGVLFNLLCLWPLLLLMRARGVPDKWLAIYAWNPLMAVEFGVGGHLDPISIFFLLWALYFIQRGWRHGSGLPLALAVMAKTQMVFAVPIILWRAGWRATAIFVLASVALMIPLADVAIGDLISGSGAYLSSWENNSGIFAVVRYLATLGLGADTGQVVARGLTGLAALTMIVWLTFRRGDAALHVGLALLAVLLLSPTFFPWYASWVLPFACLFPNVTLPAITFLLLAPYLHYFDAELAFAVRIPEVALMYMIGATELIIRRRHPLRSTSVEATPSSPDSPSAP